MLNWLLPLPVPASIYGIILLLAALELKIIKVEQVRETSTLLIVIMPVMIVPPSVGLIDAWGSIKSNIFQYAIITVVSTFVVMAVSGIVTQWVIKRKQEHS